MQQPGQALARSLKRRRLERAISISELARRSGVSKATLSSLERGAGNPSVDTVWALARSLNVPFGDLFDELADDVVRIRRIDEAQVVTEAEGFVGRKLLSRQGRGELEVYVLDIEAGARRRAEPHSPGVVEHVIVISGRVELGPEHELATLDPGDCLSFAADVPHCYHACGGPARLLSLTDYP